MPNGYGRIRLRGTDAEDGEWQYTHRLAWCLDRKKTVPRGKIIRHTCDVRHCVNPRHLKLGTQADNVLDCVRRGRRPHGEACGTAKLSRASVAWMRQRFAKRGYRVGLWTWWARRFKVSAPTIKSAVLGLSWKIL